MTDAAFFAVNFCTARWFSQNDFDFLLHSYVCHHTQPSQYHRLRSLRLTPPRPFVTGSLYLSWPFTLRAPLPTALSSDSLTAVSLFLFRFVLFL